MIRRDVGLGPVEVKPGDIADDGDGRRVDLGFRHVFGCLLESRRQRTLGGK